MEQWEQKPIVVAYGRMESEEQGGDYRELFQGILLCKGTEIVW